MLTYADYTWEFEVTEDRHLIKTQSKRKKYYYNYYQYSTTYEEASRICKSKGIGWDVASFQAVYATEGDLYERSIKNIQ